MTQDSFAQKRKYYRLKYPKRAMPIMRIKDDLFHVSELSEQGIRVKMHNLSILNRGISMAGIVNLHDDNKINVEGAVLRVEADEVILKLSKGPSFKHMVDEQRHIRNTYPQYFSRIRALMAS